MSPDNRNRLDTILVGVLAVSLLLAALMGVREVARWTDNGYGKTGAGTDSARIDARMAALADGVERCQAVNGTQTEILKQIIKFQTVQQELNTGWLAPAHAAEALSAHERGDRP